ncbi:MAG: type II toxin-antitoxin system PemK/MazF family toxin [Methanobacterium paludis]|nr:type II toxin-antitoxin system PemK/MazF family toxin [Methanobacterium paludis]
MTTNKSSMTMNRGEIWKINLNPTMGQEINKSRPGVIVNNNIIGTLNLRIIVPITGWNSSFNGKQWFIKLIPNSLNNLTKDSAVDAFQVRSVSTGRFIKKIGEVSPFEMEEIENQLIVVLDLTL